MALVLDDRPLYAGLSESMVSYRGGVAEMSVLKAAIVAALREDARFRARQYPETVIFCVVPRDKFVEAGRVLKKAYALLAAEWATDETPSLEGTLYMPATGREVNTLS